MVQVIANRYEVERLLGEGAAGRVYLAMDLLRDSERVALKILEASGSRHLELLRHEFSMLRNLSHPNIAKVFDFGQDEESGRWFYSSEFVDGVAITESCRGKNALQVCEIFAQVLRALQYIRSRGIVHYDIKPSNILVSAGVPKLIDFGLATTEMPARGAMRGTVGYAAPEVVRGDTGDARSDLYSFGVVLYESLANRHPFPGDSALAILRMQASAKPEPPGKYRDDIPPKLEAVVMRLLEHGPSARFYSANEVIHALGGAVGTRYEEETVDTTMSYLSSGALIGRDEEMAYLKEALDSLETESAMKPASLLMGEVGVGKTRLLREVAYESQLRGFVLLKCDCSARPGRALGSFAGAVESSLNILPAQTAKRYSDITTLLRKKGRLSDAANPTYKAAGMLVDVSKHKPIVFCIDDIDHCGAEELEFFEHLLRALWLDRQGEKEARLNVFASCNADRARAGRLAEVIERIKHAGLAEMIELSGLSAESAMRMLSSMLGTAGLPGKAAEAIVSATGGNPLAIEQTVQELLKSGLLFYESGKWHMQDSLVEARLPVTGEKALARKLADLKGDQTATVDALACIGRPAGFELLCAALALESEACAEAISQLVTRRLLISDSNGLFWFSSGHMAEVAWLAMSDDRLHEVHGRIYEYLENTDADLIERALHAHRAGMEGDEILSLLRDAGEAAVEKGALAAAIELNEALKDMENPESQEWFKAIDRLADLYKRSVEIDKVAESLELAWRDSLWKYPEVAASIASRLIVFNVRSGDLEKAGEIADTALKKLKGPALAGNRARVLAEKAELYISKGEIKEAEASLRQAREISENLKKYEVLNNIDYKLSMVEFHLGNYDEGIKHASAALGRKSASPLYGHLRNVLGVIHMTRGKGEKALGEFNRALEIHEAEGNLSAQAYIRQNIGILRYNRGEFEKALTVYTKAKHLLRILGDNVSYAATLVNIGSLHLDSGRTTEALETAEEALDAARVSGSLSHKLAALGQRGRVRGVLGQTSSALEDIETSIRLFQESGTRELLPEIILDKAYILAYLCGDAGAAFRELSSLNTLFESPKKSGTVTGAILSAKLYLLFNELGKATGMVAQAEGLKPTGRAASETAIAKAEVLLAQGECSGSRRILEKVDRNYLTCASIIQLELANSGCDSVSGDLSSGLKRAEEALGRARQAGRVVHVFEAALAAAEMSAMSGDSASAGNHLNTARETFEQIASALPDGYDREKLGKFPLYGRMNHVRKRIGEMESRPAQTPEPDDVLAGQEALRVTGLDERLLMRDGLSVLGMVTRLAAVDLEVQKVISLALSMVLDVTGAERGFIVLVDEEGRQKHLAARDILDEEIASPEYKTSHTMVREVVRTGRPRLVVDTKLDELLRTAKSVVDLDLRSVLCVPIAHDGQVIGVAYLDTTSALEPFSEGDLILVEEFSKRIAPIVKRAVEKEKTEATLSSLKEEVQTRYSYANIIGRSKPMREVFHLLDSVSDTDLTAHIYGETGTGKELIAKALHYNSSRKDGPFISVNCAAMPASLLESELFGHVKGAFTGANSDKPGLIEVAEGGTLFLDEIGAMPVEMQPKLLRVIEEREVRRVGSNVPVPVNIRLVCATNTPLEKLVEKGLFREDLFYRVNVVRIELPPLRERREDIPLLVQHFLAELPEELKTPQKQMDSNALAKLCSYGFPGNVRQLRNMIQQVIVTAGDRITVDDITAALKSQKTEADPSTALARELSVEDYIREFILANQDRYTETELAKKLGIGRNSLWRKRKEWELPRPR